MPLASLMVSSRCATTSTVRPCMRVLRPSFTRDCASLSNAEVASSRSRMGESMSKARAMATRCSSPPLSIMLETCEWKPKGNLVLLFMMKL
mmetsp:Transcript_116867/g.355522  ORF Transcript_116867/g.355522 Transcript_116867/m.355522 type:complete len:91 (+) Transcript_116867:143-415(+)